jgi:hypothetical protein
MLREDDLFKVVLHPGADKREKRILGQIALNAQNAGPGDTGGASLSASRCPDGCQSVAQLL